MDYERLREALSHRSPGPIDGRPPCAVLVPLIRHNGENCLLFEVRSPALKWQPGEVCFPGGRMEPGEPALACALRETEEEPVSYTHLIFHWRPAQTANRSKRNAR